MATIEARRVVELDYRREDGEASVRPVETPEISLAEFLRTVGADPQAAR